MNKTNDTVASTKGTSKLVRARFGPGMLLQHEDLEQLNIYTRELSRLMFRSLFGCGVICGLVVKPESTCGKLKVTVAPGVALACSGDPIYVPTEQSLTLDENCDTNIGSPLWVVLCGTVKHCAPRTAICSSDDDEAPSEPTRERDGFEIRVVSERPKCVCGCPDPKPVEGDRVSDTECKCVKPYLPNQPGQNCYDNHYDGKCGCNCDECSDCDCKCILLAQLIKNDDDKNSWRADHRVRRFIRPVLMRDLQVEKEQNDRKAATKSLELQAGKQSATDRYSIEAQPQSMSMRVEIERTAQKEAQTAPQEALAPQTKQQSMPSAAKKRMKPTSK